jgi:folate-binding protein YgfZ
MTPTTALRLEGRDALPLLHRISTNRLDDLGPGQARATLFCDYRGRLLHRAIVGITADRAVWLLRDDAPGEPLAAFLDRHIFRDDVRIADRSADLPVRTRPGGGGPGSGALRESDGVPTTLQVDVDLAFVTGSGDAGTPDERERARAGRPAHGHEIVETFTPFEVGLAHEVHLDKGCYTGQEVLMRLVTYQSVRRRLARISGRGAAPSVPMALAAGGESAGILTSAVPDGERWIGLAVLRNEVCEARPALEIPGGGTSDPPEPLPAARAQGRP